jgi:Bacterial membrane protein YfhO
MNQRRTTTAVIAACSVALLAPLVYPLLAGLVFTNTDLEWFHLPTRYLFQQALRAGDSVLWTPSIFAGMYLHGEGQSGLFHPLHQLLYRLFPLGVAFNLELIANYPAAFLGMFWFLRRLRFSRAAALFGGMLFAFSGFNLLHHIHLNMVAIVAHMPWLLAVADVLIVDERRRARALAFTGMALLLGSELLLGFPQAVWWNAVALAAFALFRAGQTRRWAQLVPCAGAVVVGVLLGGLQLLPTADMMADSTRRGSAGTFALGFSLPPLNLFQLLSPYVFIGGCDQGPDRVHEFGIYSGAVLAVAFIWVWIRRDALRDRRGLIAAVTGLSSVSLLLALGKYGGISLLLTRVPVLNALRAPARYIVLMQFGLAILATITMDDLLGIADGRSPASHRRMALLWIPAILGVAMTLAFNTRWLPYGPHIFAGVSAAAPGVVIAIAVTLAIHLAGRRVRWAIPALVLITAVDLAAWGIRYVYKYPPRAVAALAQAAPAAPDDPAESYAFVERLSPYSSDVLVLRGYRLTWGYAGLFPATQHPPGSDEAIRLTGTRWRFTPDGSRHRVEGGVARARLVDEQGHETGGIARLVVDRPGRLVADVDAPVGQVLAFTERFHEGWSATSDGTPLKVVRVGEDFLGCVLEPGAHRVTLHFMPRSFVYGVMMSGLGALLLLAGVLLIRLR